MSRRPACLVSLFLFGAGLIAILSSGGDRVAYGQQKPLVVAPVPQAPTLATPATFGAKRGAKVDLVLTGTNLGDAVEARLSCPGKITIVPEPKPKAPAKGAKGAKAAPPAKPNTTQLKVHVELPADAPVGLHTIRVATAHGVSNFRTFLIDDLPTVEETATNRTKETAQEVAAPCAVNARTDAEASDFFKVKVAAGQRLTFEVLAQRIGSPLDPIIVLHDGKSKRELIDLYADDTPGLQSDCRLTHTFKEAGEVIVEVRDTTYRGGATHVYRLRIGDFPGATTAFPLALQRGVEAKVGFAGPGTNDIPQISLKGSTDPLIPAITVAPKRSKGSSGWPVPVLLSDIPQIVEREPNNTAKEATKLAVPGGVSARFLDKGDLDHFAFAGKKGQKLTITAQTYEVNSPAEVLIRVLDAKGKEVGRSNPAATPKVDFTPAADGEYVVVCEHLNYLHGPNEVYHLEVHPALPDFEVSLALDRCEAAAGEGTAFAVTRVTRLNGFAGSLELSIVGDPSLSGTATVPATLTQTYIPIHVKAGTKPGLHAFQVKAAAKINGKEIVHYGTLVDEVKAAMGGTINPPPELLQACALGVTEKLPFELKLALGSKTFERGKPGKVLIEATRGKGVDAAIAIAPLFVPPNVTAAAKTPPIPKGKTKAELGLTVTAKAALGPSPIVIRATTKIGGKDFAITPPPIAIEVIEAKKAPPKKKDPPKKKKKK